MKHRRRLPLALTLPLFGLVAWALVGLIGYGVWRLTEIVLRIAT